MSITLDLIVFIVLALFIVASSILAVTTKRILRAATYLLFVLIGTAGIYFQLNYSFLGAVQLLVYAGGITVLYVFSILLTSSEGVQGIDSAAFNTTLLTRWQDTPLTLSNYYATGLSCWGLTDSFGALNKNYYSFLAFGRLLSFPERIEASGTETVSVLAGHDGTGNAALLISDFKGKDTRIEVEVKGVSGISGLRALLLDDKHNLTEAEAACRDGKIILNKEAGSAVFLLTFHLGE